MGMGMINLSEVKEGMVTKSAVMSQGRMIIGEGATVTPKMLRIFKTWGVTEIDVEGDFSESEMEAEANIDEEALKKIQEGLSLRFGEIDPQDKIMHEIYRIAKKKEIQRFAQQK